MSDNSELYLLQQQFFSGQFKEVALTPSDSFDLESPEVKQQYQEYYYRSKLSLGLYDEVLSELDLASIEDENFVKVFQYFTKLLKSGEEVEGANEFIESNFQLSSTVLKIGSFYLAKFNQLETLISLIEQSQTQDLEILSLLVLFRVYSNNISKLTQELENLKKIANDSIIFNLVESFVNSIVGKYQSSFYFFEEIEQQFPNFQNHLQLLILNLQLLQIPESQEILNQLEDLEDSNGDLIANKIVLNILTQDKEQNAALIEDLKLKNPNHVFLVDQLEKNLLFDEIVNKYKQ